MLLRLRAPSLLPVVLLLCSPSCLADAPVGPDLQAFRNAQAGLVAKINAFLSDVDACNPPVPLVKSQIIGGFAGAQDDSALKMLGLELQNVNDHAAAADLKLAPLESSAASCKGDLGQLSSQATAAGQQVDAGFAADVANLQAGIDVANEKEGTLRIGLGLRQKGITFHVAMPDGDVKACDSALAKIQDMKDANAAFAQTLAGLKQAYAARFAKVAGVSPKACVPSPKPSLFQSVSFTPSSQGDEVTEGDGAALAI